ncbi:bZIP transcription factor atfB [Aspergillus clavatus NRRL 1]|uniref:BZIP transcription factor (Atf21), putative n=1 Tax=Aspergillus clavatus (strain ATCC 1007 / CBS 513.65 / DSM 816 / NCTC 3887 / NRRL 1 / QM 1276 / 107) TaxID=344612 RepID=A1CBN2_ASPCL|nr:bZIP transcription factor (Atf21), putative [Aspergillus clavatus NRRL 1]EAW13150.1 bZIP transcription factor (Atf21), putative [Aspergillus clavatus NRRL 1]
MSTLNMLPEQSAFGRSDAVNSGPSPFAHPNAFSGDFLGLPLPDEEHLWGLSPISPSMPSWNGKTDQTFTNPNLERDLKHSHVRNGQPTPPPYGDKKTHSVGDLYSLSSQCQFHGSAASSFPTHHGERRTYGDHTGLDGLDGPGGTSKRRKTTREAKMSQAEYDEQQQEKAKREKFLERNRLAASKCRQKKKEHTQLLESRYKEQSDKKEQLVSEIARLRSEILGLKNEVLKHAQCGDEPIKLHLAQMVKKITYNDSAAPDLTDVADAASSSDGPVTPRPPQALSFGFDDPLHLEPSRPGESLDQPLRRDSEASAMTENSYAFSADDSFDDLINV